MKTIAPFVVALVACVACADQAPRRGDTIKATGSALTVPSGDPYLDFDENADDSRDIALTFDDGPDTEGYTAKVLDTLKAKGVKATFFINTDNAVDVASSGTARALVQRMVNEGHEVGNHTIHHYDLNSSSVNVESELMGVQKILLEYAPSALDQRLVRAPFGNPYFGPQSRLDYVSPIVARHGVHVGWNIDSLDADSCAESSSPQTCTKNNVLKAVDAGKSGIVLMHSIQPHTAAVLGSLIDALESRGKRFVQVESLVQAKYGKASRHLVHCRADSDCSPGDTCSASTSRCVGADEPPPPPPPPPASGEWSSAAASPLAGRRAAALAWTGHDAFVWGGRSDGGDYLADGALLDGTTRTWTELPKAPLSARSAVATAWTGNSVFLFGGTNDTYRHTRSAAAFDTGTKKWTLLPSAPDTLSCDAKAVYSPATNEAIVYGCYWDSDRGHYYPNGYALNLGTRSWRTIALSPLSAREGFALVWAGDRMIVWGGANEKSSGPNGTAQSNGASYDPVSDSWTMLNAAPISARYDVAATVSGSRVFLLGGFGTGGDEAYGDGAIYDTSSGAWRTLPSMPTPHVESAVATDGAQLFTWGGLLGSGLRTSRGYMLDLSSSTWSTLPDSPLVARTRALGAWNGTSFLVVGGERSSVGYSDAASFTP